jgi:hypothetical protein
VPTVEHLQEFARVREAVLGDDLHELFRHEWPFAMCFSGNDVDNGSTLTTTIKFSGVVTGTAHFLVSPAA